MCSLHERADMNITLVSAQRPAHGSTQFHFDATACQRTVPYITAGTPCMAMPRVQFVNSTMNTIDHTHSTPLQLTKCLALKLGPTGVRVVGVAPAAILTPGYVAPFPQPLALQAVL